MRPELDEVLVTLEREGLLEGSTAQVLQKRALGLEAPLPWYVRALSGFGSWTAALFLLGAAFECHLEREPALGLGALALVAGVWLRRARPELWLHPLAATAVLAGELFALRGLSSLGVDDTTLSAATLLLELGLIAAYPDALLRCVSAFAACFAAAHLGYELTHLHDLTVPVCVFFTGGVVLFVLRPRLARGWVSPVAYGSTLFALALMAFSLVGRFWTHFHLSPLAVPLVAAAGALTAVALLHEAKGRRRQLAVVLGLLVALALLWNTPGVIAGATLLGVGWARRDAKLLALSTGFLLLFGAQFYWLLEASLLLKAGALAASGFLFFALRFYISKGAPLEA